MSKSAKDQLRTLEVIPSKERGQNFLIDPTALEAIVNFGAPGAHERIVEIGPGLGALTEHLAVARELTLIEIEERFCEPLRARVPHARIINADVRSVDLSALGSELVVFGNLPYSFSSEIVFHLLAAASSLKRAVLLLQREFAERLAAGPGGRDYGRLSIACQLWCDVKLGPVIAGTSFHPPTQVDSQVVELAFLGAARVKVGDYRWFERVVKAAFLQRRKKLSNSLKGSGFFSAEGIALALQAAGINGDRRAETLSLAEFAALAEALAGGANPSRQ